ncbi:unnamed protein product [Cylindrotheca closterium]|uniref:Uncharacterized protein n=1 Tax=Cylindrotheca closterium TaxID=2856 RepID=A0AAD2CEV2_9STRA|nr:unnamed protein product [Cylindrotheca closterium]
MSLPEYVTRFFSPNTGQTPAQTREGTRVPVETLHSDASSAGMLSCKGDSEDAPDSDHDATLSDGAPSRNPQGPPPDTEPEDTEPEDQAEFTDHEEEKEVPLSAWVHLTTDHCRVECVGPTTNSKQDKIICGKLKNKCRLRLHKERRSSGERAAPRWYEGVPSTKDIDKETGEFIVHGQQYGYCRTEKEMDEHLNQASNEVLSIPDVNTSEVESEGQFLDVSDDNDQDDPDRINEMIAVIEEAKLKKLKAEKARLVGI